MKRDISAELRQYLNDVKAFVRQFVRSKQIKGVKYLSDSRFIDIELRPNVGTTHKQLKPLVKQIVTFMASKGASRFGETPYLTNIGDETVGVLALTFKRPHSHSVWLATQSLVRSLRDIGIKEDMILKTRQAILDFLVKSEKSN